MSDTCKLATLFSTSFSAKTCLRVILSRSRTDLSVSTEPRLRFLRSVSVTFKSATFFSRDETPRRARREIFSSNLSTATLHLLILASFFLFSSFASSSSFDRVFGSSGRDTAKSSFSSSFSFAFDSSALSLQETAGEEGDSFGGV